MHPVLLNQDILMNIMRFLPDTSNTWARHNQPMGITVNGKDLLNASLVCAAFSTPALDTLWRYMYSLRPLLRVLTKADILDSSGTVDIDDTIDDKTWTRFRIYCQRIRGLMMQGNTLSKNSSSRLRQKLGDLPLLPTLRALSVTLNPSTSCSEITLLLSPNLWLFEVKKPKNLPEGYDDEARQVMSQLLPVVWTTCGSELKSLLIEVPTTSYQFEPSLITNLRRFSAESGISTEQFLALSQISTLEFLLISSRSQETLSTSTRAAFPSLKSLMIRGPPPFILSILQTVESHSLIQLKLFFWWPRASSDASSWWPKVSALLVQKWGRSLEILGMSQGIPILDTPSFFQSFDKMPCLRSLTINGHFQGEFHDFEFLARSARSLTTLELSIMTAFTWEVLLLIHKILPSLLEFSAQILMHDPIPQLTERPKTVKPHPLGVLRLCSATDPPISSEHIISIARFINHLFPLANVNIGYGNQLAESVFHDIQKHIIEIRTTGAA